MRAARWHEPGPLHVEDDVPVPPVAADEVRVRVTAAGVCGTELHFVDGLYPPASVPQVLGHEAVGVVEQVGGAVAEVAVGQRVAVYYYLFCGSCRACAQGRQHLCARPRGVLAFAADGAFAEQLVVPARCVEPLPEGLTDVGAAPLCCGATTALHACATGEVTADDVVVVSGAGGVGLFCVQVARLRGARVLATSRDGRRRDAAVEAGALAAVHPEQLGEALAAHGRDGTADVVVDTVGTPATLTAGLGALGRGGRLVVVGYDGQGLTVDPLALVVAEQSVRASVGCTRAELTQALDLASRGLLMSRVDRTYPLEQVGEALERLRDGDVVGRLVLTP